MRSQPVNRQLTLFAFVLLAYLAKDSKAIFLSCSSLVRDTDSDYLSRVLVFVYERDTLSVYTYPGSSSVNLLLQEIRPICESSNDSTNTSVACSVNILPMIALGVANLDDNGYLDDCEFFIVDKHTNKFMVSDDHYYHVAKECLNTRMCEALGAVTKEDSGRAQLRNFGPVSVLSRDFRATRPAIQPPEPDVVETVSDATDVIIAKTVETLRNETAGVLQVANSKNDNFWEFEESYDITIRGIADLQYSECSEIEVSSHINQLMFLFYFRIPLGNSTFRRVSKIGHNEDLQMNSEFHCLTFAAKVFINFEPHRCLPALEDFKVSDFGTTKTYLCRSHRRKLIDPDLEEVKEMNNEILFMIADKVRNSMRSVVEKDFNCRYMKASVYH